MSKQSKIRNKLRRIKRDLSPTIVLEREPIMQTIASDHGIPKVILSPLEVHVEEPDDASFGRAFNLIDSLIANGEWPEDDT